MISDDPDDITYDPAEAARLLHEGQRFREDAGPANSKCQHEGRWYNEGATVIIDDAPVCCIGGVWRDLIDDDLERPEKDGTRSLDDMND